MSVQEKHAYPHTNLYPQVPPAYNVGQPYGPAPSQPYGPVPSAPNSTVNPGATVGMVIAQPVGPRSTNVTCRSCNKQTMTNVGYTASTKTHIIALLLCCFGCIPCACVPVRIPVKMLSTLVRTALLISALTKDKVDVDLSCRHRILDQYKYSIDIDVI